MTPQGQMIAATLFGPRDLRMVEQNLPPLRPDMVRIAFGAGGICGSDLHYFRHARTGNFIVTAPLILGHEIAGTVLETGKDVRGVDPGLRIAVNPSRWCGTCRPCLTGRPNLCEAIYFMGSASKTPHMQGGFASIFDVTPAQCVPIPDHLPFQMAALAEPLAVCLHALSRAGEIVGHRGLVIGAGPIGLLTMLAAHALGMEHVEIADIASAPLAYAARLGAATTHDLAAEPHALTRARPFDLVFEASGTAAGLGNAIHAARRGGSVIQIGNLPGGEIPVPANVVMAKELNLIGSFRFGHEFSTAVEMIATARIDVGRLISAVKPLREATDAMQLALDRQRSMKVVLVADPH